MEYFYLNSDYEDITINKNIFPLKMVILCFMYLLLSISLSKKIEDIKPTYNPKLKNDFNYKDNLFPFNKFETGENDTFFNITKIKHKFSYEYNIVQVEYYIGFYDKNGKLIIPSDLSFYSDLHLMCELNITSTNTTIESMANIYKDRYYTCIEFFKINEAAEFGLKIYKMNDNMDSKYYFLFNQKRFDLVNETYKNDDYFNPSNLKIAHDKLIDNFEDMRINETLKLKMSYEILPSATFKRNNLLIYNKWYYINIYDHYFCSCKGDNCLATNVTEKCKYYFYVSIIDSNRDVYKKTEYAFMDFVKADLSSDDTYPVFKEMLKMGDNAHYITGNLDIYKEHCGDDLYCKKILLAPKDLKPIYGDFLEKYIFVFFKLKVMISGRPNFNTDLFYNMEYVTYVCVGHGICFFKDYLFNPERIYGIRRNDKIILPDSDILVDIVKKHGWKEEDIFRVNLPRWDRLYEMEQENLIEAKKQEKERKANLEKFQNDPNNYPNNMPIQMNQNYSSQNPYINQQISNNPNNINNQINPPNINHPTNQSVSFPNNNNNNPNLPAQQNPNQNISQPQNNNINQYPVINPQNPNSFNQPKLTMNNHEGKRKLKTNSILIMFTWRDIQPKKQISFDYLKNFYNLISNDQLYQEMQMRNITIYLSFHRLVKDKYVTKFKNIITEKPLIEFISQQEISECLGRTSLVVTDFSSIIFDLMYRKKPFIIYVPDGYDYSLRNIYKPDYYHLIEAMKNNTIEFENKYFTISETIEKMIFYIQNNFQLDPKLERFYQMFGFKMEKQIDKFIDYLVKLN